MIDLKNGTAILNYTKVKNIFIIKGEIYFLKLFERIFKKNLFCFSKDWLRDKRFILKFKGELGDVIINLI
jgi:hypothetical protein